MTCYTRKTLIYLVAALLCLTLIISVVQGAGAAENRPSDTALVSGIRTDAIGAAPDVPGWTIYFRPGVRFGEGRTIGYWDMLVPLYFTEKSLLFFNPRVSFDDRDGHEWNVGIGYRHLIGNEKLILGGNSFFDWRKSPSGNWYKQVGVGGEVLTEWVNARVNGYISLSDAERVDPYQEWYFGESSLEYSWAYSLEEPLSGLDYEVGFKVPYVSDYVETWVYGLGYTYFSDYADDVQGWGGRIEVIPADFVKLNYEYRQDRTNDGEHYGEVTFEIPFSIDNLIAGKDPFEGIGDFLKGSRSMKERLYEQVRRDVDIVVATEKVDRTTFPGLVIPGNPTTFYYNVYYVAPGYSGAGTLSSPGSMAGAEASGAPTIFLLAGDYGEYIWDNPNTNLFGMGFDPSLINVKMPFYPWMFPGPSTFTNSLNINASDIAVKGLMFNNGTARSINASGGGGYITITGNSFASYVELRGYDSVTFTNNRLTDNGAAGGDGLYVRDPASGHLDALVSGNTFYVAGPSPRTVHLRSFNGVGSLSATITNNTIYAIGAGAPAGSCNGIWIDAADLITASIAGNTIVSTSGNSNATGMRINSDGDNVYATILNNSISVASSVEDATAVELRATGPGLVFGSLSGNSGNVNSATDAVMFIFRTGNPGGGSSVNWSGNNFTTGTGWLGNYDVGSGLPGTLTNGRIWTDFQPGDLLTP